MKVLDENIVLRGYDKKIRQVTITDHGKTKPALIITNEFDMPLEQVVRKYSRRWIVEKAISEQAEFFHLNRLSSSIVIKVDFDLTMSILTHNLYRIFAHQFDRYKKTTDEKIYQKFIHNSGMIRVQKNKIQIMLEKKRTLPTLLEELQENDQHQYGWIGNKALEFIGASNS